MTVPSEINKSGPYHGNGVTTVFAYGFKIVDAAHLRVVLTDPDGQSNDLILNSDYTVTGVGNDAGGNVVKSTPLLAGYDLTIVRNVPFVQETDLENQGAYYAETVEDALDLAAMRDQQLREAVDRAVKVPENLDAGDLDKLVEDITYLADVYLGAKPSDPTERNDGSPLKAGDMYFNTTLKEMRLYDGGQWMAVTARSLNTYPKSFVGDGNETEFSLEIEPAVSSNVFVWVGGVRQVPDVDYTVSGATVTLATAPGSGVEVDTLVLFQVGRLPQTMDGVFDSRADVEITVVDGTINTIITGGYYAGGDGGGALYKRVASEPSHAGKVQSADGTWWELSSELVYPEMFGAKGDGVSDDTIPIQEAINFGKGVNLKLGAKYFVSDTLIADLDNQRSFLFRGPGMGLTEIMFSGSGILLHVITDGHQGAYSPFIRALNIGGFTVRNHSTNSLNEGIVIELNDDGTPDPGSNETIPRVASDIQFLPGEHSDYKPWSTGVRWHNSTFSSTNRINFRGIGLTGVPIRYSGARAAVDNTVNDLKCLDVYSAIQVTNAYLEGLYVSNLVAVTAFIGVEWSEIPEPKPLFALVNAHIAVVNNGCCGIRMNVNHVSLLNTVIYVDPGSGNSGYGINIDSTNPAYTTVPQFANVTVAKISGSVIAVGVGSNVRNAKIDNIICQGTNVGVASDTPSNNPVRVGGNMQYLGCDLAVTGNAIVDNPRYSFTTVKQLNGGSPQEIVDFSIPSGVLVSKPSTATITSQSGAAMLGQYLYDDSANSPTNIRVIVETVGGSNIVSGMYRFGVTVN